MKLSTLTLGALIIFSTNAIAQTPKEKEKPKTKTTTTKEDKTSKAKQDSVKTANKNNTKKISPDYCPPCGMG